MIAIPPPIPPARFDLKEFLVKNFGAIVVSSNLM
jgi:hypothetical protein